MAKQFSYLILSMWAVWLCVPLALAAEGEKSAPQYYQAAGTKKMAELLQRIYRAQDFTIDPNKTAERAAYYRQGLQQKLDLRTELKVRMGLAEELLRSGESLAAVTEMQNLRAWAQEKGLVLAPFFVQQMRQLLALSYLRLGEQENCLLRHNHDSCLFPLRAAGVHQLRRGSTGAISELSAVLQDDTGNYRARWLLNLAYMTLGEYPAKVPAPFLLPAQRFASDYDIGRFPDVAPAVGLNLTGHAGGVVMDDFDGDGLFDLMISGQNPLDQLRFFRNQGDGSFAERTREAGLTGETGGLNTIHTDYNNDGRLDVLVLRGGWWGENGKYPLSLLRNNGDGTFDDVTEAAGLLSLHPTQTAGWADYDNDGWLDLFVGHEANAQTRHPSQLFHNNGDGTFTETGAKLGLSDLGFVKGVAWGDFNNDGRPDLYVSVKGAANRLFRNDTAPRSTAAKFTDVTATAGVAEPSHSFATWFWDYDNDGWEDILAAGYYDETENDVGAFQFGAPHRAETPRLYHNNQDGTFSDVTRPMRLDRVILAMGANFGDLDNDGWLDCYFGTGTPDFAALLPNKMFRNAEGKVFQDVTTSGGFGHLQKGHAVAFGDLNNDGTEDIFEVIGGAYPGDTYQSVLFAHPGHGNHWLALDLQGVRSNRAAIGARLRVTVNTPNGTRDISRAVRSGGSFGDSPFRQHIGLGNATTVKEVEIKWPSGTVQRWPNLPMEQTYRIREDAKSPVVMPLKKFALTGPQHDIHGMKMR